MVKERRKFSGHTERSASPEAVFWRANCIGYVPSVTVRRRAGANTAMLREKHKGRKPRGESTDAMAWGGPACSSDEGSVMGLERRGRVRQS